MHEVELYDHQRKAVSRLHNGSILCGGVGAGKSRVAMRYYIEKETPRDVYVITTAKKRDSLDWESEGVLHGIGKADASFFGTLKVDSWNNLWKYVDVTDAFFIFDEQRLVGSGAWVGAFYKVAKKNRWILLSATPGDTWLDYIPVFVANGFYKNRTEFLREHVVYSRFSKFPKVDRYIAVGRLVRLRNSLLVDMPYERHTTRVINEVLVDYDEDLFKRVVKDRWHVYENRPLRDVSELFSVMRKVVNSSPSRLTEIQELLKTHPKLIVFYNFDYELEILRMLGSLNSPNDISKSNSLNGNENYLPISTLGRLENEFTSVIQKNSLKSLSTQIDKSSDKSHLLEKPKYSLKNSETTRELGNTVMAEWNGHKHEPIPTTDSWIYLVQYRAGSEGWNCVETDTIVFYSLTYSYRDYEQSQGRIDRLNTSFTTLNYYVFKSTSIIDKAIWKTLKVKRSFNEKKAAVEILADLGKFDEKEPFK